jgi:septal ring factor EnvC (AmiA/AmiB activator)
MSRARRVVAQFFHRSWSPIGERLASIDNRLTAILAAIADVRRVIMATAKELKDVLDAINATTNDMASVVDTVLKDDAAEDAAFQAEIDRLKASIAGGGVITQEQLDALVVEGSDTAARLTAVRDTLKGTASDPANPAPLVPEV